MKAYIITSTDNGGTVNVDRVIARNTVEASDAVRSLYARTYDNPRWHVATINDVVTDAHLRRFPITQNSAGEWVRENR